MSTLLQASRTHRTTSKYGSGQNLNGEVFSPAPPVQNPNGAITQTMEISCTFADDHCGHKHSFIYGVFLASSDPGTITSITLTVYGQAAFTNTPNYGVLKCDDNGAYAVPCGAGPVTDCADSETFQVNETGEGTSTYTETWDFTQCSSSLSAGQQLAIYVDLCVNDNDNSDCGAGDPPYIQRPVNVTINVSRPAGYVAITPCRVVDTRNANGPFGGPPLRGGVMRTFTIPDNSDCNIPNYGPMPIAYSLNFTAVPHGRPLGYLTVWPAGDSQPPLYSTLNSYDGRTKANAAIVPAGDYGAINVFATDDTDLVIDISGYFKSASDPSPPLAFYKLTPCRIADTRDKNEPPGFGPPHLFAGVERDFSVMAASCNVPDTAKAYSLNFTAITTPSQGLGALIVWPFGQAQPNTSTLNANPGNATANAAIVSAGTGGEIAVYAYNDVELVIDIDGYFAPPTQGALSLYTLTPCRVLDTRPPFGHGRFNGRLSPPVDVVNSGCGVPSSAQAYVLNATVVPSGLLGYLTLWPDGSNEPNASTLNSWDGAITSNLAVVPAGNQGKIDADAAGLTNLILDISSYFAPPPQ